MAEIVERFAEMMFAELNMRITKVNAVETEVHLHLFAAVSVVFFSRDPRSLGADARSASGRFIP
jgi:hypothetical protein